MERKLSKRIKKETILVIAIGILFSYILANMLLSSGINGDRVLSFGQVFEVSNKAVYRHSKDWFYDSEWDLHKILSDNAKKSLGKWNEEVDFSCMYLDLEQLNVESADWFFNTYDQSGNFLGQQVITVQNGENWIPLNTAVPFKKCEIVIVNAKGMQFRINQICLYENIPQKRQLAIYMSGIFVVFCLVMLLLKRKVQFFNLGQISSRIQDFLEYCYILLEDEKSTNASRWTAKKKNRVRTLLFLILFLYMLVVYNLNLYKIQGNFRYHGLLVAIIFVLIAVISKEGKLKAQKYDYHKLMWWYAVWGITCISDFILTKKIQFIGWIMLLAVGYLMFVWKQMKNPQQIVCNMMAALEILAVAGILYTMLCRTKYDGLLYNGYMGSASDFGVLAAFLCIVFGWEFCAGLRQKEYGKKNLFYACLLAVSFLQVLLSGNMMAVFFAILYMVWVLCVTLKAFISVKGKKKLSFLWYGIGGFVCIAVYYVAVKQLPAILHMEVLYINEVYESIKEPWVIETLAAKGNPVYQNVKYHSVQDMLQIWRAYIREWNIFGHKNADLRIWNKSYSVNNQFLQVVYRYGLIIAIPYVGLFFSMLKHMYDKLTKERQKMHKTDYLMIWLLLFWCLAGSFAAVEYPLYQPVWIVLYVWIGMYIFGINKNIANPSL
ncbi:MAG: hypothetical protein J6A75_09000 [Lachnospiraceae bacterium]|nr:hypothetical protein [Lachnospiraceae bacterium]